MRTRWAEAVALVAAVAFAAPILGVDAAHQQQPPLLETIQTQIADRHGVIWSASRKLTWDDFSGAVANADVDEAAHLEYGLFYGVRCSGRNLEFRVITAMIPADSWVQPAVVASPADNARTLDHEQTHFDLAEVHAHKMRKYFAGLYEPCMKSNDELADLADGLIKTQSAEQKRYDDETRNGRLVDAQKRWDADVASRLNEK